MTRARDYAPTPWINAVHPVCRHSYRFRLRRTRRDGSVYVQFHRDSETAAGKEYKVPPSRPYWLAWGRTSARLLDTTEWHPNVKGVGQWKRHVQAFMTNGEDIDQVVFELPKLIDPKLGRPQVRGMLEGPHPTSNKTHTAARNARYLEMTLMLRDVLTRIRPVRERLGDARKMKGYSKEEITPLLNCLDNIQGAAEHMDRMLETNAFVPKALQTRHTADTPPAFDLSMRERSEQAERRVQQQGVKMAFDIDDLPDAEIRGTPLSPAEQRIAIEQQINPVEYALLTPRGQAFYDANGRSAEDTAELEKWECEVSHSPKGFGIVVPEGLE